jgi:acetolactate synthase I/II/III large subunit
MFMATGYALASRTLGFCIVGKGPAVTNTLTGVLESRASFAPVVAVAVGTARNRLGARAFQELDQIALINPLVKWAHRIESSTSIKIAACCDLALCFHFKTSSKDFIRNTEAVESIFALSM